MKNASSFVLIAALAATAMAAPPEPGSATPEKRQVHWSVLWGVFKSKNHPSRDETREGSAPHESRPAPWTPPAPPPVDADRYEEKSILFGAVKWTRRKPEPKEAVPQAAPRQE
jgi:hypothetical protein